MGDTFKEIVDGKNPIFGMRCELVDSRTPEPPAEAAQGKAPPHTPVHKHLPRVTHWEPQQLGSGDVSSETVQATEHGPAPTKARRRNKHKTLILHARKRNASSQGCVRALPPPHRRGGGASDPASSLRPPCPPCAQPSPCAQSLPPLLTGHLLG